MELKKMVFLIIFVCICNVVTAIWILVSWIRHSKSLPRAFVRHMSLRYVRFYLVFAMMMNRFIRFHIWMISNKYTPIPYWPLTLAEKVILLVYLATLLSNLVLYFIDKRKGTNDQEDITYRPFSLITLYYPWMIPGLKVAKSQSMTIILACLSGMIWFMGFANILVTALFSLKNVR
jgi:hypothetical protein